MISHLADDELRTRIEAKFASGALSRELPHETYGGPSAGQRCHACDEAIAAAEAEIEVGWSAATAAQYFHVRCYNLLRFAREPLPNRDQIRAERTTDKTRRGGLPAPKDYARRPSLGDGRPCDGCGETIHPTEILFAVSFANGELSWRFHDVCCEAWVKFKPE
jgi:hypothetical protein